MVLEDNQSCAIKIIELIVCVFIFVTLHFMLYM